MKTFQLVFLFLIACQLANAQDDQLIRFMNGEAPIRSAEVLRLQFSPDGPLTDARRYRFGFQSIGSTNTWFHQDIETNGAAGRTTGASVTHYWLLGAGSIQVSERGPAPAVHGKTHNNADSAAVVAGAMVQNVITLGIAPVVPGTLVAVAENEWKASSSDNTPVHIHVSSRTNGRPATLEYANSGRTNSVRYVYSSDDWLPSEVELYLTKRTIRWNLGRIDFGREDRMSPHGYTPSMFITEAEGPRKGFVYTNATPYIMEADGTLRAIGGLTDPRKRSHLIKYGIAIFVVSIAFGWWLSTRR